MADRVAKRFPEVGDSIQVIFGVLSDGDVRTGEVTGADRQRGMFTATTEGWSGVLFTDHEGQSWRRKLPERQKIMIHRQQVATMRASVKPGLFSTEKVATFTDADEREVAVVVANREVIGDGVLVLVLDFDSEHVLVKVPAHGPNNTAKVVRKLVSSCDPAR